MKKELVIALDAKGHKVVVINEILFYGKKNLPWDKVEQYLKRYIGKVITVAETGEEIHIANAAQGIEEMIVIARKTSESENLKDKNSIKAKHGWYRYITRFALPIMSEDNVIIQYHVYLATLIVRKDRRKRLHLYDIVHVKKESSLDFTF